MREIQDIHEPFVAWLNKIGIPYHRNRSDKRTTATVGDPDFLVCWMSHCVYIECKVPGKTLSEAQEKRVAYIRAAGNKVVVAYSLEMCIEACKDILCVKDLSGGESSSGSASGGVIGIGTRSDSASDSVTNSSPAQNNLSGSVESRHASEVAIPLRSATSRKQVVSESSASPTENNLRSESASTSGEEKQAETVGEVATRVSPAPQNLFIAKVCGIDYVCTGDSTPGGTFERVRRATMADIINIR